MRLRSARAPAPTIPQWRIVDILMQPWPEGSTRLPASNVALTRLTTLIKNTHVGCFAGFLLSEQAQRPGLAIRFTRA
jgi:hypothetical protein